MDSAIRDLVWQRARSCCEYCRLHQSHSPFRTFHIDHIRPRKHGGSDDPANLALACDRCSFHKGYDLSGIDDATGQVALLFNPRTQSWDEHFQFQGVRIFGLTPTGRATVQVCNLNSARRIRLHAALIATGEFPPTA